MINVYKCLTVELKTKLTYMSPFPNSLRFNSSSTLYDPMHCHSDYGVTSVFLVM